MHPPTSSAGRRARTLTAALVLGAFATACGQAGSEPASTVRARIAGGTVDVSHQDVFLLGWHEGQIGGLCTATLIAPNLLLSARHCVAPDASGSESVLCGDAGLGEPHPPESFFATNDPEPRLDSRYFHVREVRVPDSGVDTCGYDISLLILTENVPAEIATPAIPRIDHDAVPGEAYTAVGYGQNANGETSGSRMQLAGLNVACDPGNCGDGVESTEFMGERGICSGDSGGPALDATGKVLGVVSRGGPGCSEPIYGSVAAWRDLITTTTADAAALGGYDPPFWVETGSSDPAQPSGGAGGESNAPSEPPPGVEGDACHGGSECGEGLVCYAAQGSAVGACTATCKTSHDCADGLSCEPASGVSVCTTSGGSGELKSSCGVAAPGPRAAHFELLLGAAALLGLRRRRRSGA
jgi:hypothetical protein